jgi:TPR repeat protein
MSKMTNGTKKRIPLFLQGAAMALSVLSCTSSLNASEKPLNVNSTKFRARITARDPEALYLMGNFIHFKQPPNYKLAAWWFNLAAELGEPHAMFALGCMYYYERGVPKDGAKALDLFERAAKLEEPRAKAMLGQLLLIGGDSTITIPKDVERGIALLRSAAEAGETEVVFPLAMKYIIGDDGIEQNYAEAQHFFEIAAATGNVEARCWAKLSETLRCMEDIAGNNDGIVSYDVILDSVLTVVDIITSSAYSVAFTNASEARTIFRDTFEILVSSGDNLGMAAIKATSAVLLIVHRRIGL